MNKQALINNFRSMIARSPALARTMDIVGNTRWFRAVAFRRIDAQVAHYARSRRVSVFVELSSVCNASCVFCPHSMMTRKQEIMRQDVFLAMLRSLKEDNVDPLHFVITGMGEPMADRDVFERIAILKREFPKSSIFAFSNFSLMDEGRGRELLASGLDAIKISINETGADEYRSVMGLKMDRTLENIETLLRLKKESRSSIKVSVNMVLIPENRRRGRDFIDRWKGRVDGSFTGKAFTWRETIPLYAGQRRPTHRRTPYPCASPFEGITVLADGGIAVCCMDYDGSIRLGNVLTDSIWRSFNSPEMEHIRNKHLTGRHVELELCRDCSFPYKNAMQWLSGTPRITL